MVREQLRSYSGMSYPSVFNRPCLPPSSHAPFSWLSVVRAEEVGVTSVGRGWAQTRARAWTERMRHENEALDWVLTTESRLDVSRRVVGQAGQASLLHGSCRCCASEDKRMPCGPANGRAWSFPCLLLHYLTAMPLGWRWRDVMPCDQGCFAPLLTYRAILRGSSTCNGTGRASREAKAGRAGILCAGCRLHAERTWWAARRGGECRH
jgi:hypothetical protein